HAQGDALAYELRYRGVPVTSDQGSAAYGSALFLNYLRRSVAHDAPIVDGHGQAAFKPGQLISFADGRIAARHDGYPGASVTRSLSVGGDGAVDETKITATTGTSHRLGAVFNADCPVAPGGALSPGAAPAGDGFGWWRQTQAVRDALPEVQGQGFFELLDHVYQSGQPFVGHAVPLRVQRDPNAPLEERFIDFVYQPIHDQHGKVSGIFVE
ncbi:hypothetical protein LTR94_030458, partial [Friedmanniomyces endolithicus]